MVRKALDAREMQKMAIPPISITMWPWYDKLSENERCKYATANAESRVLIFDEQDARQLQLLGLDTTGSVINRA